MKRLVDGLGMVALLLLGCGGVGGDALVATSDVVVPSVGPGDERVQAPAQPAAGELAVQTVSSRESQLRAMIATARRSLPALELRRLVLRGDHAVAAFGIERDGVDNVSFVNYHFGPGGLPHSDQPRWHANSETYAVPVANWGRLIGLDVAPSVELDVMLEEWLARSASDGVTVTLQTLGVPADRGRSMRQLVHTPTASLACDGGQVFHRDDRDVGLVLEFCVKPSGSVSGRARLPHNGTNMLDPAAGPHEGELIDGLRLAPNGELTVSGKYTLTHRPAVASFSGSTPPVTLTLEGSFKLIEPRG